MKRFTESLRSSVRNRDWYTALTSALTLPDVCGRLATPEKKSSVRYPAWFQQWLAPAYTFEMSRGVRCFLSGDDCYALRCSYLHEGGSDISGQAAQKALDNFHFVSPIPGSVVHKNLIDNTLQLQVDLFCLEMADAVDRWAGSVANDPDIQSRMKSLLIIHSSVPEHAIYTGPHPEE